MNTVRFALALIEKYFTWVNQQVIGTSMMLEGQSFDIIGYAPLLICILAP